VSVPLRRGPSARLRRRRWAVGSFRLSPGCAGPAGQTFLRGAVALRHQAAAREPAKERTERDPDLGCKGDIGGQTDDDAERQAQHGSERDGDSDAHVRECMTAAAKQMRWPCST
jgi:hypothetical protein